MKQTAVEWLGKELEDYGDSQFCKIEWETLDLLIQQAKAMEKEQIINAYEEGYNRVAKLLEDAAKQNGLTFKSE